MCRFIFMIAGVCILASPSAAQTISQYYSTSMSCKDVQAAIRTSGMAIMRYQSQNNPSLERYDRYVANGNLCPRGQIVDDFYIPAADTAYCKVKRCKLKPFREQGGRR